MPKLNHFIRAHRIVNVEKRLIDGERGTGWLFLSNMAPRLSIRQQTLRALIIGKY
jgi:hypothetical protein